MLDPLNAVLVLIITGVGFLIHLYSTSYMQSDASYHRFFCVPEFVRFFDAHLGPWWQPGHDVCRLGKGVGVCSYLLIGFWFSSSDNAAAGRKAFIANRIG